MTFIGNQSTKSLRALWLIGVVSFIGCADFIEIDPPKTEITSESVFTSDASATSAIKGIYSLMMNNTSFTKAGLEEYTGIASDELLTYSTRQGVIQFFQNSLIPTNNEVNGVFWREAYRYINNANTLIENLSVSHDISQATRDQLEGEARFIRAFCHFYLVNLFGDIPYVESSDYRINKEASRIAVAEVYQRIESDLITAVELLPSEVVEGRTRPNKAAAQALLARTYLYTGDWQRAEAVATAVIDNDEFSLAVGLGEAFLPGSLEALWQLVPVVPGTNTPQGQLFILNGPPNAFSARVSVRQELIDSFEPGDLRLQEWIGTFSDLSGTWNYVYKYKVGIDPVVQEYTTVLRLAEQYLIRAEARAQLGNFSGAQDDLNALRSRAGLPDTGATDLASLLLAIEQERRVELFGEWGHRWLDLKRTGRADHYLSPLKADWEPTDIYFPIPESEILLNSNLTQNEGY